MIAQNLPQSPTHAQKGKTDTALLVYIAVRVALAIVGSVPVLMVALVPAVILELVVELATGDDFYYQQHRWCPFVGCVLSGVMIFLARRIPFLEAGRWMGPLLIVMGFVILLR